MQQVNEAIVVTKESFQAVGFKWAGTFAEAGAGGIRLIQQEMQNRFNEIKHIRNREALLGLSYLNIEGGFTHYTVVEVDQVDDLPVGMETIALPTLTYAKCEHLQGQSIDASYDNIYSWIESKGYALHEGDMSHFENYPMQQDPYTKEPEFTIMIPIVT